MDLLMAEIARKRKSVELAKSSDKVRKITANQTKTQKRQFLRAGDLRRFEEEQEWEQQHNAKVMPRKEKDEKKDIDKKDNGKPKEEQRKQSNLSKSSETNGDEDDNKSQNQTNVKTPSSNVSDTKCLESSTFGTLTVSKFSPQEITEKLRSIGQPIRLFGEQTIPIPNKKDHYDDSQREQRLLLAQQQIQNALLGKSDMDDFRLGRGHGIRNPFLEK